RGAPPPQLDAVPPPSPVSPPAPRCTVPGWGYACGSPPWRHAWTRRRGAPAAGRRTPTLPVPGPGPPRNQTLDPRTAAVPKDRRAKPRVHREPGEHRGLGGDRPGTLTRRLRETASDQRNGTVVRRRHRGVLPRRGADRAGQHHDLHG